MGWKKDGMRIVKDNYGKAATTLGGIYGWDILLNMLGGKDGGRVTKRGIGRARRGFGRVMGRKK